MKDKLQFAFLKYSPQTRNHRHENFEKAIKIKLEEKLGFIVIFQEKILS